MYIIDASYFQKPLEIPNINSDVSENADKLNQLIDSKVRLCLKNALGFELFKELDSNIVDGELKTDADQKWKDLVNGLEYTKNGVNYNWQGLICKEGEKKSSLLAWFVYNAWVSDPSFLTGVSEGVGVAKNVNNVNVTQTVVNTWNAFVTLYQDRYCDNVYWFDHYFDVFPYYYDYYRQESGYVSLLKFLDDNSDNYPNASKQTYRFQNQLGL